MPREIGELQNLTWLSLRNNKLTSIPNEFGKLKNLTTLGLDSNQIATLPREIGELQNLSWLDLANNQLTTLTVEITKLKNLTTLNLGSNQITTLPSEIGKLQNLTWLSLYNNKLRTLPTEIGKLQKLTNLYLNINFIEKEEVTAIQTLIPGCKIDYSPESSYIRLADEFLNNGEYSEAYDAIKKAILENGRNYNNWFNLSWYALFVNKPEEAISAAKKSLELSPNNNSVISNLVLGHTLNNDWNDAKKLYKEWKDKKFMDNEKPAREVFLEDILALEKEGIKHKNFEKIKKMLK